MRLTVNHRAKWRKNNHLLDYISFILLSDMSGPPIYPRFRLNKLKTVYGLCFAKPPQTKRKKLIKLAICLPLKTWPETCLSFRHLRTCLHFLAKLLVNPALHAGHITHFEHPAASPFGTIICMHEYLYKKSFNVRPW